MLYNFLILYVTMFLSQALYLVPTYMVATLIKVKIEETSFGFGPAILKILSNNIIHKLKILPTGAYVKMEQNSFDSLSRFNKSLILISGTLVLIAIGSIISNINAARILEYLVSGTLHPVNHGSIILTRFIKLLSMDYIGSFGVVCLVLGIFNLLPIPLCNGGQLLMLYIFPQRSKDLFILPWIGLFLIVAIMTSWIIALCTILF